MALAESTMWGMIDPSNPTFKNLNAAVTQPSVWDNAQDMVSGILELGMGIGTTYMEYKTWEKQLDENNSVMQQPVYTTQAQLNGRVPTSSTGNVSVDEWLKAIMIGGGLFLLYTMLDK